MFGTPKIYRCGCFYRHLSGYSVSEKNSKRYAHCIRQGYKRGLRIDGTMCVESAAENIINILQGR